MHYFFIKSIVFLYMFRGILCSSSGGINCSYTASGHNRFNKEIVHQVGKQNYILLRCTVNNKFKKGNRSSIPGSDKYFFLIQNLKMGCRLHPISCSMDASSFLQEGKVPNSWNWPLTSIQVKNGWHDTFSPTYAFTACVETRCFVDYWTYNVCIFMVVPIWRKFLNLTVTIQLIS